MDIRLLATIFALLLVSGCSSNKVETATENMKKEKKEITKKVDENVSAETEKVVMVGGKEKAEQERIAKEKAEAERIAKEKAEQERIAKEKAEAERIAREKAEQERIAKERAEARKKAFEELEKATSELKSAKIPTGSTELTDDIKTRLDVVAEILIQYPDTKVKIKAYTDSLGSSKKNLRLSQMRADRAKEYLISKGVNPQQIEAKGFGETNFINPENPASLENRRIELELVKQ